MNDDVKTNVVCEVCGHCFDFYHYSRTEQCPACLTVYEAIRDFFGVFRGVRRTK